MLFVAAIHAVLWGAAQAAAQPASRPVIAEARAFEASGRYAEARDVYERLLAVDANDRDAQDGLASAAERLALKERADGNKDAALAELLQAQKMVPANARVLYDLGVLEEEMRLYHDADATLATLEQQTPGESKVLYAVARVKLDLGQLAAAESHMEAYLRLRPADASAHYGLGTIYMQGANFEKARAEFERSIALQPLQTEAYYQLGQSYLNSDACAQAEPQFAKTLERQPKHGGALTGMGICAFKTKQFDAAEGWLRKAIEAAPEYQPGHYYLGLALRRLGKDAESREQLALATKLEQEESKRSANRLRLTEPATRP